jgi:hypothetical protein
MAIGVTRAALRLAPGAVNRSGERGVRGFRSSLTQQCEESDPQRREVRPGVARALIGRAAGEIVLAGDREIEILSIE